jgi:predicted methyltransferase
MNAAVLSDLQVELPRAQAVAKERNRYIHDQWVFDAKLVAAGRIRRAKLVFGPPTQTVMQDFTMSDLEAFLQELGKLQQVFAKALKVLNPTGVMLHGA